MFLFIDSVIGVTEDIKAVLIHILQKKIVPVIVLDKI
jgi:hypothetical protein